MLTSLLVQQRQQTGNEAAVLLFLPSPPFHLSALEMVKVRIPWNSISFTQCHLTGEFREVNGRYRTPMQCEVEHRVHGEKEWVPVDDVSIVYPTALCVQFYQLSQAMSNFMVAADDFMTPSAKVAADDFMTPSAKVAADAAPGSE